MPPNYSIQIGIDTEDENSVILCSRPAMRMQEDKTPKYKPVNFDSGVVEMVLRKSNGHCWYCGKELTIESRKFSGSDKGWTYVIDHFIPRDMGGSNDIENLVPACWSCNSGKGRFDIEHYRENMTRKANGVPRFTDEQVEYLKSCGFELPEYEPHVFYYEYMNEVFDYTSLETLLNKE